MSTTDLNPEREKYNLGQARYGDMPRFRHILLHKLLDSYKRPV